MEEEISASMLKDKEFYFIRNDCVYTISFLMMNNSIMIIENNYDLEKIEKIYLDAIEFKNGVVVKLYNSKNDAVQHASFLYKTKLNGNEIKVEKYNTHYVENEIGVICPEKRQSFEEMMEYFKKHTK